MDSPIQLIKNGIIANNWSLVCQGYEEITGELIKANEIIESPNELIEEIEQIINKHKKIITPNPDGQTYERNPPEPKNRRQDPPPIKKTVTVGPFVSLDENGNMVPTKKGYYGNDTKPITDDNIPLEEINKNKEKAAITKERKTKRSPSKKYDIKCSQCEQNFESDRQESKDFGQKCPKCLQDTINGKIIE
jgi:hypothetical protein